MDYVKNPMGINYEHMSTDLIDEDEANIDQKDYEVTMNNAKAYGHLVI